MRKETSDAIEKAESAAADRAWTIDGAALVYYAIMALVWAVIEISEEIRNK